MSERVRRGRATLEWADQTRTEVEAELLAIPPNRYALVARAEGEIVFTSATFCPNSAEALLGEGMELVEDVMTGVFAWFCFQPEGEAARRAEEAPSGHA